MSPATLTIICGQTATGKSDLAVQLALENNAEIISADSRQVYRGLDIGSNKITKEEMQSVTHYGINIAEPGTRFTVADFQRYAREKITEIFSHGKNVIIVGGTGLYIDTVMFQDFTFGTNVKGSIDYSGSLLWHGLQDPSIPRDDVTLQWIGLTAPREFLVEKIRARAIKHMPLIQEEIKNLLAQGVSRDWLHGLGLEYRYGVELLERTIDKETYIELLTTKTWQYAKRQMTWFKRNPRIQWRDVSGPLPL